MTTTLTTSPSAEGGGGGGGPLRPVETNRIVARASSSLFEDHGGALRSEGGEGEGGGKKREGKTQYEIERDAKVRENEARMRALGIDGLAEKLAMDAAKKKKKKKKKKKYKRKAFFVVMGCVVESCFNGARSSRFPFSSERRVSIVFFTFFGFWWWFNCASARGK